MAQAGSRDGKIGRAIINFAETVMVKPHTGSIFTATVTDSQKDRVRIQLQDLPLNANISSKNLAPVQMLNAHLKNANIAQRTLEFERIP